MRLNMFLVNRNSSIEVVQLFAVKFTLSASSNTVIVLSQMDTRYYDDLKGRSVWSIDFALAKEGENQVLAQSTHTDFYLRSVHLEMELEAGTYTVYVRLDHSLESIEVCTSTILRRLRLYNAQWRIEGQRKY